MIFEAQNNNWQNVRDYAMGKQDIAKYKESMKSGDRNSYVKIDWKIKKGFMNRFIAKLWSKQPMKSYRMVARLMSR